MSNASIDTSGVIVACPSCGQRNRLAHGQVSAETRCGKCKTPLGAPAEPIEVHDAPAFDALIANADVPVIVDFWAPWCGPCRMVAPEIAHVAAANQGKYLVVKVNTDEVADLSERFGIRSIPTMAVFAGGKERGRTAGARPAADIEAFVRSVVDGR